MTNEPTPHEIVDYQVGKVMDEAINDTLDRLFDVFDEEIDEAPEDDDTYLFRFRGKKFDIRWELTQID